MDEAVLLANTPEETRRLVADVNDVIDQRSIETLFQPLVHLATGEVVGYEALTRGPAGSSVESPLVLLEGARIAGRLDELDWLCAANACDAAIAAQLHPSMTVFLNFEPTTLLTRCPPDLLGATRRAQDRLRVVVDMNEASLTDDPGRLFDAVAAVRETGWGIAIDNASAAPSTLALLPLVHPDVLKIDLRGLRGRLATVAEMSDGARIYAEQSGAKILAQGIEETEDVLLAGIAGASFGQGWHFGRPGPLPSARAVPRSVFPLLAGTPVADNATPFEIVSEECETAITEKRFLVPLSHHLEGQVDANGPRALLLESFELGTGKDHASRSRLQHLAGRAAFLAVLGSGLPAGVEAMSQMRTGEVAPGDPIGSEWNVIVLGPHYAVALVAHEVGNVADDPYRHFEYAITHDRDLILRAALALLRRLASAVPGFDI